MGIIKGKGLPTKQTAGSVGDTYVDVETNKKYSCVYSIEDSMGSKEYRWEYDGESKDIDISESVNDDVEEEDIPEAPETREWPKGNNRKQYNKHYKPNHN